MMIYIVVQEDEEERSRHGPQNGYANGEEDMEDNDAHRPLLADPKERGIKKVGLVYSPRKSWWTGIVLIVLSVLIFVITILTAVL